MDYFPQDEHGTLCDYGDIRINMDIEKEDPK
jgi:hypothetical protein